MGTATPCADKPSAALRMSTGGPAGPGHSLRREALAATPPSVCRVIREQSRDSHQDGWSQCFDKLETHLTGMAAPRRFEAGPQGIEFPAFGPSHLGDGGIVPDFWAY